MAQSLWERLLGRNEPSGISDQQIPLITRRDNNALLIALPDEIGAKNFARLRPRLIPWYLHHRRYDGVSSATCAAHALIWSLDPAARTLFLPEEVEILARAHQDFAGAQDMLIALGVTRRRRLKPPFKKFDTETLAQICAHLVATESLPFEHSAELSQSLGKVMSEQRGFLNALMVGQKLHLFGQMLMGLWDPDFSRETMRQAIGLLDPRGTDGLAIGKETTDFVNLAYSSRTHEIGGDTMSVDLIGESSGQLPRLSDHSSRHVTVATIGNILNHQRAFFLSKARHAIRTYGLPESVAGAPATEEDPLIVPSVPEELR